jgi:hypothetical protein
VFLDYAIHIVTHLPKGKFAWRFRQVASCNKLNGFDRKPKFVCSALLPVMVMNKVAWMISALPFMVR